MESPMCHMGALPRGILPSPVILLPRPPIIIIIIIHTPFLMTILALVLALFLVLALA